MRAAASQSSWTHVLRQAEAGRDLDDLLVAALHGAIALVQMDARCRAGRRGSAPRCAWRAECIFRGRPPDCRRRAPPRPAPRRAGRARSAALCTTRMPRPPPPKAALMMSGKPICLRDLQRLVAIGHRLLGAGQGGHVRSFGASARAAVLSPIISSNSGRGPTKVMPAFAQARANSAFSERKP